MYTSYFLFLVLFNGPIMDSEQGPATAGPRIVYILSSGGLSVSALGLFLNSKSLPQITTDFWGETVALF